jgi:hypothetical protein
MTSVLAVVSLIFIMLATSLTLQPLLSSVSTSSSRGERADGRLLGSAMQIHRGTPSVDVP